MHPTAGRQSIMTPSHGGSRLAPAAGAFDDPRPTKSAAFREQAAATIIGFFQRHPRAPQVTDKTMQSPTQVEFQQMFKFLVVAVLDDDYAFGKGGKKFDEECMQLLKDLDYPAIGGLSRTAIGAPGSPTNWSAILAMLVWLVELADVRLPFSRRRRARARYLPLALPFSTLADTRTRTASLLQTRENWMSGEDYADYDLLPAEQVPLDTPTLFELFLWDYLSNAYAKWYEGSEECPEEDRQLEDNFRVSLLLGCRPLEGARLTMSLRLAHPCAERKFESFEEEMIANEKTIEDCQREWAELTSKPVCPPTRPPSASVRTPG